MLINCTLIYELKQEASIVARYTVKQKLALGLMNYKSFVGLQNVSLIFIFNFYGCCRRNTELASNEIRNPHLKRILIRLEDIGSTAERSRTLYDDCSNLHCLKKQLKTFWLKC